MNKFKYVNEKLNNLNLRNFYPPSIDIKYPILTGSPPKSKTGFKYYLPSPDKLHPMKGIDLILTKEEFDECNRLLKIELRYHEIKKY